MSVKYSVSCPGLATRFYKIREKHGFASFNLRTVKQRRESYRAGSCCIYDKNTEPGNAARFMLMKRIIYEANKRLWDGIRWPVNDNGVWQGLFRL